MILYSICICIEITLLRAVADDLLKCEKIEKWCLLKLTGRKAYVKGNHCSKFESVKRASVKQLFTNLWYYVLFQSPIYKYGRNGAKRKWASFKKFKQFKKLTSLKKIIEHNF